MPRRTRQRASRSMGHPSRRPLRGLLRGEGLLPEPSNWPRIIFRRRVTWPPVAVGARARDIRKPARRCHIRAGHEAAAAAGL